MPYSKIGVPDLNNILVKMGLRKPGVPSINSGGTKAKKIQQILENGGKKHLERAVLTGKKATSKSYIKEHQIIRTGKLDKAAQRKALVKGVDKPKPKKTVPVRIKDIRTGKSVVAKGLINPVGRGGGKGAKVVVTGVKKKAYNVPGYTPASTGKKLTYKVTGTKKKGNGKECRTLERKDKTLYVKCY